MKNFLNLAIILYLLGIFVICNKNTPEEPLKVDEISLAPLNKPVKEYRFAAYFPLIPNEYGIRTYEWTFGSSG